LSGAPDSLFSRWSRRKLAGRRRAGHAAPGGEGEGGEERHVPETATEATTESAARAATGAAAKPTAPAAAELAPPAPGDSVQEGAAAREVLEKLGLPDPDTLGPGDDFRAFMAREVPAFLRRRALRRLWRLNPVLANIDGLVDHGEDFHSPEFRPAVLTTAYQVGKGMILQEAPAPEEVSSPVADTANRSVEMTSFPQAAAADEHPATRAPEAGTRRAEESAPDDDGAAPVAREAAQARQTSGAEAHSRPEDRPARLPRPARMRFRPA
jgi:hypothetical protein